MSRADIPIAASTSRGGVNTAVLILGILNRETHNNAALRTGSELLPGTRGCERRAGYFAARGHVQMLRIRLARRPRSSPEPESQLETKCFPRDADDAAANGHLEVVRLLRAHGVRCTADGANWAAANGHLEILRDLREHGIHCTSDGADLAARNGHLEVICDLRAHGIHCTERGANKAADKDQLDVSDDLWYHGIKGTSLDWRIKTRSLT